MSYLSDITMQRSDKSLLVFKTVNDAKWQQVVAVVLLSAGVMLGVYLAAFEARAEDSIYIRLVLICVGLLFLYRIVGNLVRGWFRDAYEVSLDDDELLFKNLFGTEYSIRYADILRVQRIPGRLALQYSTADRNFGFCPAIDFLGYLNDFILMQIPSIAEAEKGLIEKLRSNSTRWRYTRTYPFSTNYESGKLEELERSVAEQKRYLIETGVLDSDVFYGDERARSAKP